MRGAKSQACVKDLARRLWRGTLCGAHTLPHRVERARCWWRGGAGWGGREEMTELLAARAEPAERRRGTGTTLYSAQINCSLPGSLDSIIRLCFPAPSCAPARALQPAFPPPSPPTRPPAPAHSLPLTHHANPRHLATAASATPSTALLHPHLPQPLPVRSCPSASAAPAAPRAAAAVAPRSGSAWPTCHPSYG